MIPPIIAPGGDRQAALAMQAEQFGARTAALVAAVTNPGWEPGRDEHEQYREYVIASLAASPWARVIKASDFTDYADLRSQRAARARGEDPGELLSAVHRVASLAKRWLLGTHQGSVDEAHLPGTSTSSRSASTADRPAAAWCSTGCWNSPPVMTRSATAT